MHIVIQHQVSDPVKWEQSAKNIMSLIEQNRLRVTDDFKEGVKAVAERRVANFKGR